MSPGRMLTSAHLHGEGVICRVEDSVHLLSILQNLLSHLRYAFHLGVHRTDQSLFPLIPLVTHQSKAEWRTQKSISGFLEGGPMLWFWMEAASIPILALLGNFGPVTCLVCDSFSSCIRWEEWLYLPRVRSDQIIEWIFPSLGN